MTSSNPFADRIKRAAQEGYMPRTGRDWKAEFAARESRQEAAAYRAETEREDAATPKQVGLIRQLLNERQLDAEKRPAWSARLWALAGNTAEIEALTKTKASALIEYLFGLPEQFPIVPATRPAVPEGRYAVESWNGNLVFLEVDRPTEGRWAGRVFVSMQHGDDWTTLNRTTGDLMLERIIADGPREASLRYGREIGRCGVCGRTLTKEDSRAAGIGPVCQGKNGW